MMWVGKESGETQIENMMETNLMEAEEKTEEGD